MKVFSKDYPDSTVPSGAFGGKASNLSELTVRGFNVPPGFALAAGEICQRKDIGFLYKTVCNSGPVAVRSSAIGEDGAGYSFAGQYDTYLNVSSLAEVMLAISKVRESARNTRVQSYQEGFDLPSTGIGVVVQKMVRPVASGVMFTAEPVEGDTSQIVIEAVRGLGDKLVSGHASPDYWLFDKQTELVVENTCIDQPVLTRQQLSDLVVVGKKIEQSFGRPQDIEWAIDESRSNQLYVLQTRPITTLGLDKL
jgi:phosphoenolpyruvate synthase/pyruvate phosphate dikinase